MSAAPSAQNQPEIREPKGCAEGDIAPSQIAETDVEGGEELGDENESGPAAGAAGAKLSFRDRVEDFIGRLSTRNNFWHRVCSLIWLPYAFKSGIRMKRVDAETFTAELPFRRFNKNWYNAMAGAALLANSEIAGGMYIFGVTGGEFTIVCKELTYRFLRPCYGPALYHVLPREDLKALVASGREFNVTLELEIVQQAVIPAAIGGRTKDKRSLVARMAAKSRKVGQCQATFHVTPALHNKLKRGNVRNVGKKS
ncbi:MAG: PaaI family thioesterase [Phycisphaerales bacterium]